MPERKKPSVRINELTSLISEKLVFGESAQEKWMSEVTARIKAIEHYLDEQDAERNERHE